MSRYNIKYFKTCVVVVVVVVDDDDDVAFLSNT